MTPSSSTLGLLNLQVCGVLFFVILVIKLFVNGCGDLLGLVLVLEHYLS